MKGTRPLTTEEIVAVSRQFGGTFEIRNRSLFMLGVSVGGRISELLALKIGDVYQNDAPVTDLLFQRAIVKGGEVSRAVPVNADGRSAISDLIAWHLERCGDINPQRPLFPSRKYGKALGRTQAHRILAMAFTEAGLNGKLATHSMRKAFAQRIYDASGDIFLVKELLGHKSVETTKQYLGVSYAKMQAATKAIELDNNRRLVLLHSLSEVSTGDLITELLSRGVDVSSAISQMQVERTANDGKVIPIRRRKAG